jgi:drug/metabolite transporter (DMT)-like permease
MTLNYILIIAVVATLAVGQLLFKLVGLRIGDGGFQTLLHDQRAALLFGISLVLYGVATIAWIWALRQVPLTTAYMFMSMGFIIVPVMSHFVLGEALNLRIALGSAMIIAGIMISATA